MDVTYDSVAGGGAVNGVASPANPTWSHTSAGDDRAAVLFAFCVTDRGTLNGMNAVASWGGEPMTLLGSVSQGVSYRLFAFGLTAQPTGAQTVNVIVTQPFAGLSVTAQSVSFAGAGGFGALAGSSGAGASWSVGPIASANDQMVVAAVGQFSGQTSSFNHTQRSQQLPGSGTNLTTGHANGAASITFSGNNSASVNWAGAAVQIQPVTIPSGTSQFYYANAVVLGMLNDTGLAGFLGASPLFRIYSGDVPADADAPLGSATQLVQLTCASTPIISFTDIDPGGRATFAPMPPALAVAGGMPTFWRVYKADGTTVAMQGTAGPPGSHLVLNNVVAGGQVSIDSFAIYLPEGA